MAKPREPKPDALLGDLESIRTLLEEEDQEVEHPDSRSETDVPMLDDVVEDPALTQANAWMPGTLTDDVFDSLLGDGWKTKADGLLDEARATIDHQAHQWSPQATDELNDALRVRIDDTIYAWLQKMLKEHIDELRSQVLDAMSDEIKVRVKQALGEASASKRTTPAIDSRTAPRRSKD